MKKLILKATYGEIFTHQKLPQLFLKLIKSELNKLTSKTMLIYIQNIYKINTKEIIQLLTTNISISKYSDNVIITFNNIKVKELKNGEPVFLDTLINMIDNGNREVKGLNIINNTIRYLESHIDSLFKLSRMRGRSNIWQ